MSHIPDSTRCPRGQSAWFAAVGGLFRQLDAWLSELNKAGQWTIEVFEDAGLPCRRITTAGGGWVLFTGVGPEPATDAWRCGRGLMADRLAAIATSDGGKYDLFAGGLFGEHRPVGCATPVRPLDRREFADVLRQHLTSRSAW